MYAIFGTGGKQYKASIGDVLDVENININVDADGKVELKNVLAIVDENDAKLGPEISDRSVIAEFISEIKDEKVIAFKSKRRKGYRRKIGHRQKYSRIRITEIK
jgi:large subunit ribosomal protein L21